jgi:hypothetical protein
MKTRQKVFLGLIVLVSCVISFFMLTRGHVWPDDFAGYLLQAKSLQTGQMAALIQRNTFMLDHSSFPPGPVAYPWGFPVLLTPFYTLFGMNPLALKLPGILFYAIFLVSFFYLARTRLPENQALVLTGLFSVLPALLSATDLIQSDIPFLAFSTLSLVLILDLVRGKRWNGLFTGLCIFMAFFLRTNGLLLFVPLLVVSFEVFWPDWVLACKKVLPVLLVFAGLFVLQALLLPGGQESYFSHFNMFTSQRLWGNILYYVWLPASAFDGLPGGAFLYPLLAGFFLINLINHWRRDAALFAYGLLTVLLFVVWPERQGLRFIFPVLPILFIGAWEGMQSLGVMLRPAWEENIRVAVYGFWGILLAACLFVSANMAYTNMLNGREINGPFDQYSKQLYEFIRGNTPADSVIIFMRPRALRLFTDRDAFMTENCQDLSAGDYVAIHEKMADNGQIPPGQITSCSAKLDLQEVFNNKRFTVYKILK